MIKILVTGAGSLLGQGIIKTLRASKYNIKIFSTDYFKKSIGFIWSDYSYIMPDILKDEENKKIWLKKIIKISNKNKIDVIIPGLDFELSFLSINRHYLEKKTESIVLVSSQKVIKVCSDKWLTYKFLKNNNFNCPDSCLPSNIDNFLKNNNFPLIVKPRNGSTSKNVFEVKNYKNLLIAIKNCPKPIIQKKIGNDNNEFTVGAIFYQNKLKSIIGLRRKLKNGNTSEAIHEKSYIKMYPYLSKIVKKLSPFGPINLQLKFIKNKSYIFEINPRFSGTTPIRNIFGVNELEIVLALILKKKSLSKNKLKYGVVLKYLHEILIDKNEFKKIK